MFHSRVILAIAIPVAALILLSGCSKSIDLTVINDSPQTLNVSLKTAAGSLKPVVVVPPHTKLSGQLADVKSEEMPASLVWTREGKQDQLVAETINSSSPGTTKIVIANKAAGK